MADASPAHSHPLNRHQTTHIRLFVLGEGGSFLRPPPRLTTLSLSHRILRGRDPVGRSGVKARATVEREGSTCDAMGVAEQGILCSHATTCLGCGALQTERVNIVMHISKVYRYPLPSA